VPADSRRLAPSGDPPRGWLETRDRSHPRLGSTAGVGRGDQAACQAQRQAAQKGAAERKESGNAIGWPSTSVHGNRRSRRSQGRGGGVGRETTRAMSSWAARFPTEALSAQHVASTSKSSARWGPWRPRAPCGQGYVRSRRCGSSCTVPGSSGVLLAPRSPPPLLRHRISRHRAQWRGREGLWLHRG
jgi:hypothetical protein